MNPQVSDNQQYDDEGIDLGQVVDFLSENWKKAVAGAMAGAVIGVGGWATLANYKAESVLVNNGAINFMSWRGLQKSLPLLASQLVADKRIPAGEEGMYMRLSDAKWWAKNVVPTYSLTKADTKDLAAISKDLQDSGGTTILNLVVTAQASSKEAAVANVDVATQFIKQGSAYLSIKNLINGFESQILNANANLQKQIVDAEVDLKFMRERAKNLETLRQRFPQNAAVSSQQIVDLKDSNAKYMPISTQLVAINSDINNTVESLQKLRDQLAKTKTLRAFVEKALPIVNKETNGLKLVEALLHLQSEMRQESAPDDVNAQQTLNDLEATLIGVRTFFTKSLDTDLTPQVSRPGVLQPAAGGFVGGALVVLLVALGRKAVAAAKLRLRAKEQGA